MPEKWAPLSMVLTQAELGELQTFNIATMIDKLNAYHWLLLFIYYNLEGIPGWITKINLQART